MNPNLYRSAFRISFCAVEKVAVVILRKHLLTGRAYAIGDRMDDHVFYQRVAHKGASHIITGKVIGCHLLIQ